MAAVHIQDANTPYHSATARPLQIIAGGAELRTLLRMAETHVTRLDMAKNATNRTVKLRAEAGPPQTHANRTEISATLLATATPTMDHIERPREKASAQFIGACGRSEDHVKLNLKRTY
jgi:hypothetical protein